MFENDQRKILAGIIQRISGITTNCPYSFNIRNDYNKINLSKLNKASITSIDSIFKDIKNTLDHEEHGATPLLGINGVVMKCHGSTTSRGIKNSLVVADMPFLSYQPSVEETIKNAGTLIKKGGVF